MTNCTNLALLTQAWVVVALWSPWVFFFTKQSLRKNKMSHTWWWLAISFIQELKHRKNCKSYPVCMAGQTWISVMKSLSLWKKVAVHLFSKYEKFCKESQSWQLSVPCEAGSYTWASWRLSDIKIIINIKLEVRRQEVIWWFWMLIDLTWPGSNFEQYQPIFTTSLQHHRQRCHLDQHHRIHTNLKYVFD